MCTVSFIPVKKGIVLTSNRDEHFSRGIAFYPDLYILNGQNLIFPKDTKSTGTWFISNDRGHVGVLLNGAFEKHVSAPPYRKSRGLMLLELFQEVSPFEAMKQYNFSGIENFTIILWEQGQLREINWDGEKLKTRNHDPGKPHIWSSVTLYDTDMINERHRWFNKWITSQIYIDQPRILDFHSNTQISNNEFGLRIFRNTGISTISITSLLIQYQKVKFYHNDCIQNIESILEYDLQNIQQINSLVIANNESSQKN